QRAGETEKAAELRKEYEKAVAEFNRRLAEQNDAIAKLGDTLEKWKAGYNEAVTVARAKEAERLKLAQEAAKLSQRATGCETKNAELFKVGNEILDRYAAVGFGDVVAIREPFLRLKRAELQNLVQDYQDKLLDQKAVP